MGVSWGKEESGLQRYGMTVPAHGSPLAEQRGWLEGLMELGYTDLWSSEIAGSDAFTPLALAAAWLPSARLGTAVAPVFTRGPALLAMQAAALAEAAPGRFVLGIGSSSPAIVEQWNGLPFEKPYQRMRDTLRFLRRALAGERVDEDFESFTVRGFRLERPPAHPPPIFLAALREGMLRLAAREADGVCLGLLTAGDVERVVSLLRREGPGKEVVLRIPVCPTEDAARARATGRRMLAAYLNVPVYARFHEWLGRGAELQPVWEAWAAGNREAAAAAVPEPLVDELFVHGRPAACRDQIQRFVEAGVTTPVLGLFPFGGDLREAARWLAPP